LGHHSLARHVAEKPLARIAVGALAASLCVGLCLCLLCGIYLTTSMSSAEEDAAVVVDEAGTDTEAEEQNVSDTQAPATAAPTVPASPQPARAASPQPARAASPVRAAAAPAAAAPTVSPKRKSSVGFARPAEKLHVQARDPETAVLLKALQDVYNTKLKPVEDLWSFNHYHQDAMTTADLEAKPQVLLLGQYSTGKTSFIRYMLGRDFPGMHIGPEPSTEAFQVSLL
jgi:N-terminal EH-domain containing protein